MNHSTYSLAGIFYTIMAIIIATSPVGKVFTENILFTIMMVLLSVGSMLMFALGDIIKLLTQIKDKKPPEK